MITHPICFEILSRLFCRNFGNPTLQRRSFLSRFRKRRPGSIRDRPTRRLHRLPSSNWRSLSTRRGFDEPISSYFTFRARPRNKYSRDGSVAKYTDHVAGCDVVTPSFINKDSARWLLRFLAEDILAGGHATPRHATPRHEGRRTKDGYVRHRGRRDGE